MRKLCRKMKKAKSKPPVRSRRRACNLTLSEDAREMVEALKPVLVRDSASSLVEFLIVDKHRQLFPGGPA